MTRNWLPYKCEEAEARQQALHALTPARHQHAPAPSSTGTNTPWGFTKRLRCGPENQGPGHHAAADRARWPGDAHGDG